MSRFGKAIIVDLDGTLCNIHHRLHYIMGDRKNWHQFFAECVNDTPNMWCVELVKSFNVTREVGVIYVSGRSDKVLGETLLWLRDHKLWGIGVDIYDYDNYSMHFCSQYHLLMRKEGDYRPDAIVKGEMYDEIISKEFDILFAIDDRSSVVDMWRSKGITCLQCADGNF